MPEKSLRVLQLASFLGNIGDNANHLGTRLYLSQTFSNLNIVYEDLEIREFFRKQRVFDHSFVEYVNSFDLLIIGGGNFFELWVDHSCNNTSIDISINLMELISTPILFYALGVDAGMGVSESGISKFKVWLDYVISKDTCFLTVRNDGAMYTLDKYLGTNYSSAFKTIPDGGFFAEFAELNNSEIYSERKHIGVNLAGDMLDLRFLGDHGKLSFSEFLSGFVSFLCSFLENNPDYDFVFYSHIFKDIEVYYKILIRLPDHYARNRVRLAPYLQGNKGAEYIFSSYSKCAIILGNRFHSNVCAIGQGIPTIGLVNYIQISNLYKELKMTERCVDINLQGFEDVLSLLVEHTLKNLTQTVDLYKDIKKDLSFHRNDVFSEIKNWFDRIQINV